MKIIFAFAVLLMLSSCGNNENNNSTNETELKDPAATQPPADAIPDTMTITNDSLIRPDASGSGTTTEGTRHDSM